MTKTAIIQSCYLPWKGYFDIINYVDNFVVFDDVQYNKRSWQNRNKILIQDNLKWLTIPVKVKDKFSQKINEVEILDNNWNFNHIESIKRNYSNCTNYKFLEILENQYNKTRYYKYLYEINYDFIKFICKYINIETILFSSSKLDYLKSQNNSMRLINICKKLKSNIYVTTETANNYIDSELFKKNGINIEYYEYKPYKKYNQNTKQFIDKISIIDLLLMTIDCSKYLNTFHDK